ncbi:hypothetical protein D9613_008403 [Agrocybe pediades]|uniref:Uncharacterized protein n=1 Tax=Agrocybe pediades TaxID=84607 RepID=A0A8H4QTY7_9AGAR|nr:hypothetical protein D9613_008403 [Agrocybe pediades]
MRSFIGLLIFVLCFLEVVFAVPAPVGSSHSIQKKGAASLSAKKIVPNKAPAIKHAVAPKKKAPTKSRIPKTKTALKRTASKKSAPLKTKTSPKKTPPKGTPEKKTAPVTKKIEPKTTCALKNKGPAAVSKKVKREEVDFGITRRSPAEFIGFHGTTGPTAAQYMSAGRSGKHLPILAKGFNGNDAELGLGLYVTDDVDFAHSFAVGAANLRNHKENLSGKNELIGKVCEVEAISEAEWDDRTPKIWVPDEMLTRSRTGGESIGLSEMNSMAQCQGFDPNETVKFSAMDIGSAGKPRSSGNQFVVPTTQFNKIFIRKCMSVTGQTKTAEIIKFFGRETWPQYDFGNLKEKWHIKT